MFEEKTDRVLMMMIAVVVKAPPGAWTNDLVSRGREVCAPRSFCVKVYAPCSTSCYVDTLLVIRGAFSHQTCILHSVI